MKPCKLFLCDLYYYMIELFGFREQHMPLEMLHSIRQNFTWSWNQSFQQWWNSWKTQWQKLGQMPQVCIYIVPVLVHEHIHQISGYFLGGGWLSIVFSRNQTLDCHWQDDEGFNLKYLMSCNYSGHFSSWMTHPYMFYLVS